MGDQILFLYFATMQVNSNVLKFLYIGIGAFVAAYLQMFCWTATCESREVGLGAGVHTSQ